METSTCLRSPHSARRLLASVASALAIAFSSCLLAPQGAQAQEAPAPVPSGPDSGRDARPDTPPRLPEGVSDEWWASAQEQIRLDVEAPTPASLDGLSPAPFSPTGEVAGNDFGWSVAGVGDVNGDGYADLAVGAPGFGSNMGKVYVFHGGPGGLTGTAAAPAFAAAGEAADDLFGWSAAGAGDVNGDGYADLAVGAPGFGGYAGKVYVFHGGTSGLTGTAAAPAFAATGEIADSSFGISVAGAGDVNGDGYADLAVGASGFGSRTGKVYVFHGSAGGLTGTATLSAFAALGEVAGNDFGWSVAGVGDVNGDGYADLAVGAVGFASNRGRVYVFHGGAGGLTGSATASAFTVTGEAAGDFFGWSVAGVGDVNGDGYADLAIGAPYWFLVAGKVYAFHGGPGGLTGTAAAPAFAVVGQAANNFFGVSVAGAGDVNGDGYADLAVGADSFGGTGKVYVFHGGPGGLTGTAAAPAFSAVGAVASSFGWSVAGAGDVNGDGYADLAVGADAPSDSAGRVYAFHGAGDGLRGTSATPGFGAVGEAAGNAFGWTVAGVGDVNGDGFADLAVGVWPFEGSGNGKLYLFHGGPGGLTGTAAMPAFSITGEAADSAFGVSVAGVGDVNGDGYADLAVGASAFDSNTGKVYVFHGGPNGLTGTAAAPAFSIVGEGADNYLGRSVAGAGDVNGDGYADLAVGAPSHDGNTGKVYVFHGGPGGLTGTAAAPGFAVVSEAANNDFGVSVAGAGDVNGDGYADLAVGAPGFGSNTGKVYVFHGGPGGLTGTSATPAFGVVGEAVDNFFGISVAGAGDVNGDGYADLAVSAYGYDGGRGKVYVFHGGAGGPTGTAAAPAFAATGEAVDDYFGATLAGAGDVNGDGYADLAVGAWQWLAGAGKVYVFHGGPGGLTGTAAAPAFAVWAEMTFDRFGVSVAGAGDVNGDGFADLAVGAYAFGINNTGKVYAFYGGGAGAGARRRVLAQQLREAGPAVAQPWGLSLQPGGFTVRMLATNPAGRTRAKLEVEACARGLPFGGACTRMILPTWADTTATAGGTTLQQAMTGLDGDTLYRWRARVLYAPLTVTQAGITPPPKPAHGPWRRFNAQAVEADVRTNAQHQLLVVRAGSGSGTVSSSPAGIDCGATCAADFDQGTVVTLSAVPDSSSTFTGWSGACSGTGACMVTMDTAKSVTATFTAHPNEPEYKVYLPLIMR